MNAEPEPFQFLCSIDAIAEGQTRTIELPERIVLLTRLDGRYYCVDDVCTHDGGPLGEGEFCDGEVACPRHGARFDLRTGRALKMPATVDTACHEVKVEAGNLYVRLNRQ
jgi:3-phenylpropionate/trans-cinnamate dioxygenase ferredoxin subunit